METSPAAEHSTVPYHAQVDVFDPTVSDAIPMWTDDSLGRGVAAGRSGLAIATRSDFERGIDDLASVRIRVWIGDTQSPSGSVIYEGPPGSAMKASWWDQSLEATFTMWRSLQATTASRSTSSPRRHRTSSMSS
jgi:hypothetical protein